MLSQAIFSFFVTPTKKIWNFVEFATDLYAGTVVYCI